MALMGKSSRMRRWAAMAALVACASFGSPAWADAPGTATPPKTKAQKPAAKTAAGPAKPAPAEEALSPRWIGPTWEIKGLTVWVFTPGHFEGR